MMSRFSFLSQNLTCLMYTRPRECLVNIISCTIKIMTNSGTFEIATNIFAFPKVLLLLILLNIQLIVVL